MDTPSLSLCDCPNGCVILTFGYVRVHLPRAAFLAFADRVATVVAGLRERAHPVAEN